MSTKALLGLVAAIIVVGGGAWYFTQNPGAGPESITDTNTAEENATGGTFADLIGRAGSWKCEVSTSVEEAPSEGIAYIADGKVRTDFTSTPKATGKPVTAHMIQADGYIYSWSEEYPQGIKMLIPEGEAKAEATYAGMNYDSQVDYSCEPWMADVSVYTPPASVTFMELGENGMPQMPN